MRIARRSSSLGPALSDVFCLHDLVNVSLGESKNQRNENRFAGYIPSAPSQIDGLSHSIGGQRDEAEHERRNRR